MSSILPSFSACCVEDYCADPVTVAVPGPPGPIGPEGPGVTAGLVGVAVVDHLIEARDLPSLATNRYMVMLGGAAAGDSFGGTFWWDPNSVLTDNYNEFGGSVITPNLSSGPGRWRRL